MSQEPSIALVESLPVAEKSQRPSSFAALLDALWRKSRAQLREYVEVVIVIAMVTAIGWSVPHTYHTFGLIYLLAVIALSLRVGRWPVLAAAVLSAATWIYVFIPPRLSFSVLESDDGLLLGTYVVVALVAGQLTARVRAAQREEHERERRATALFQLTRALAEARTLDEAVGAALNQANALFEARTALMLADARGILQPHAASSYELNFAERMISSMAWRENRPVGRFTENQAHADALHMPMCRAGQVLGVFVVRCSSEIRELTLSQRELIHGFSAQIALLVERELLRAASEREKFFAESDRLHRTLLDSVSHELKTPLSVLRSAAAKVDTDDAKKRAVLASEIGVATRRLDRLVGNLLNQTRLDSGAVRPQLDWCDARDLVNAAKSGLGDVFVGRPFRILVPAEMPLFLADAPLMEQAIANLLLNAALHTPAGNAIEVAAGWENENGERRVFVRVDDSGPGIPIELRGSLFQKFQRGQQARAGGLGLGLSIVRGFMLAQGGDVTVAESPVGGARFTLYLPHIPHECIPNDEN